MNAGKITSTLTALALCVSSTLAMAQPRDERDGRKEQTTQQNRSKQDQKSQQKNHQDQQKQRAKAPEGNQSGSAKKQAQKHEPTRQQHAAQRGAGPQHSYNRGDRLPPEMRTRHAYVEDWRSYLEAPPRGHQWVQLGADFVLIAVATGIITQIVLNSR